MAKLRKMLGSVEDPAVRELMGLIETQSRTTLTRWAAAYTAEQYLPLTGGEDGRLSAAVEAVSANLRGDLTLKEAKVLLAEARKAAQEETDPVRQAAARAVSTACGTLTTPTNALGFAFYGAAAWAYHTAGTEAAREEHDRLAQEGLERILTSLRRAAVPDEADPVKVNWNC